VEFETLSEIVRAAKDRLPHALWDHASGGAGSETTLRRNRLAMETLALKPRILRGAAEPDLSTTFLGQRLASPVLLAPVGSIGLFDPEGALPPARVAARRGTMHCVGVLASPGLGEVAKNADAPLLLQIYVRGDRDWLRDLAARAEAAGYVGLCLTVDSPGGARRDRDLHNRYRRPEREHPNLPADGGSTDFQLRFCWDDFDWLRSATRLPIILKGILTAEDAVLAVEHGAQAVYVSNHGGRELDHVPSTIEVLPEIVAAVGNRAEVIVDSGFLRGTDVVKALALGVKAVLIGKLQVWGLAAGGESGLERALEILDDEIRETLQLIGAYCLSELSPVYLRPTMATRTGAVEWNQYEYAGLPHI
jgi:isopentenyl diphosphate isomerase/L-lactate dehydrogenase-like FMN-dependent dehydrogenase